MEFASGFDYLSGVNETVPRLFDPALARRHLARAKVDACAFLADAIAGEIGQRMTVIKREFAMTLIHGYAAEKVADRLKSSGQFRTIIPAGPLQRTGTQLVFDAEAVPMAPETLDCVVSVLVLQSVNDLPGALIQMKRALKPDGLLLACLFAGSTLVELRTAWLAAESELSGGVTPRVAPFADIRDLGALLQRAGFALPVADIDRTVIRYSSPLALMREIKALGFSNALAGRSRRPVTPALLAKATADYEQRSSDPDGRIRTTVEIGWLTGWVPHPSQPQPLKPGSAKARLAAALGTKETRLPRD